MKRTDAANVLLCADVLADLLTQLEKAPMFNLWLGSGSAQANYIGNLRYAAEHALNGGALLRVTCCRRQCCLKSYHHRVENFVCPACLYPTGRLDE